MKANTGLSLAQRLHNLRAVHTNFRQFCDLISLSENLSKETIRELTEELQNSLKTLKGEIDTLESTQDEKFCSKIPTL